MRRLPVVLTLLAVSAGSLGAQTLSDRVTALFTFGSCGEPLCLDVNAAFHGKHFNPSLVQGQDNLLAFFNSAIATSLGNIPFTTSNSGVTFAIRNGVPVATSVSAGPIFADRAPTLGRGRLLAGFAMSGLKLARIRGVPLDNVTFRFAHQNVGDPALGNPIFENDIIDVTTDLDVRMIVGSFYATYGLLDRLDIGFLVPFVHTSVSGRSTALIDVFQYPSPHAFGTQDNPSLTATASSAGSKTGIGDVAVRAKAELYQGQRVGFSALADVRLPTGDKDNFTGGGETLVRALGVLSARWGDFSPHLNLGGAYRSGDLQNNSLLGAIGFDQLMAPWATLAIDLATDTQLGASKLTLPPPAVYTTPVLRTVPLTDVPDRRDNRFDLSLGGKFQTSSGVRFIANVLIPLADAGITPKALWTVGIERSF